ncbi:MAG: bifunctional DNA-formamidopyrimidine glycosylase/DNA-(apurinic or apyrimidinic site) lyase [Planctomycetota bacterium]
MPELPEVETVCRTLARHMIGQRITRVRLRRRDVVRPVSAGHTDLLLDQTVTRIERHGKQLALVGDRGACVCVHLGMSGSLCVVDSTAKDHKPHADRDGPATKTDHIHVVWTLGDGAEVWFRDPRRFGGIWTFASEQELRQTRWAKLGPDALVITPGQLHAGLSQTRRALKAALLDQHLVAGLGNIYVDELLFATSLHPLRPAATLAPVDSQRLVRAMRRILGRAIEAGGSTLRDYVDAAGQVGGYQTAFKAYGRGGEACGRCGEVMDTLVVAGRTTSACSVCQVDAELTGE